MALLSVVKYGNPILRKKTAPVTDPSSVLQYIDDMLETMYEEGGMGLAANQVGLDMKFMVVDIGHAVEDEEPRIFINAEIIGTEGEIDMEEGCLSVPEIRAVLTRPEQIDLKFMDEDGDEHVETFNGLISRVIQHEVDHLNGVFFTDYLTPAKRGLITKRLAEIAETGSPSTGIVL